MACIAAALPPWPARSSLKKTMASRGAGRRGRLWSLQGGGAGGSAVASRRSWARRLLVAEAGTGSLEQGIEELGLVDDMRRESVHGFVVVPEESTQAAAQEQMSHFGVSWKEVFEHMAIRGRIIDDDIDIRLSVVGSNELVHGDCTSKIDAERTQFVLGVNLKDAAFAAPLKTLIKHVDQSATAGYNIPRLFIDCSSEINQMSRLGNTSRETFEQPGILAQLFNKRDLKAYEQAHKYWTRQTSDDLLRLILLLVDSYVTKVPYMAQTVKRDTSPAVIWRMMTRARSEVFACVGDESCKCALDCLAEAEPGDQVAAYRCIASHESRLFEQFSLAVLEKNNCLGLSASIPKLPCPKPLDSFRGQAMTHEIAEGILIGWFGQDCNLDWEQLKNGKVGDGSLPWSWRVVAGQNAAYDHFACQIQLFYPGRAKNSLWYDPIFRVETFDGQLVWRKRHYRVRRDQEPGTFRFSVLDNGVVSQESWTVVDVDENLEWALLFYRGAASAAGLSYTGAVFVTPNGQWPDPDNAAMQARIDVALKRCGMKRWELFLVKNSPAISEFETAPLEVDPKVGTVPDQALLLKSAA